MVVMEIESKLLELSSSILVSTILEYKVEINIILMEF